MANGRPRHEIWKCFDEYKDELNNRRAVCKGCSSDMSGLVQRMQRHALDCEALHDIVPGSNTLNAVDVDSDLSGGSSSSSVGPRFALPCLPSPPCLSLSFSVQALLVAAVAQGAVHSYSRG